MRVLQALVEGVQLQSREALKKQADGNKEVKLICILFNAHAVLPLPTYFSVTQDEMEKRFGIYKGHSPGS